MIEVALGLIFAGVYYAQTKNAIEEHYNVEGFSEEERQHIVTSYFTENPEEAEKFIEAEAHVKARMILEVLEAVEDGMKENPAKWYRVRAGRTLTTQNK